MAGLFRSNRANNTAPAAIGLRVQSSLQGIPIPIGCGRYRAAGNLINYAGFVAAPVKSPGSKGGLSGSAGKGDTGQYNYYVSGIVSLGEGGIVSLNRIFNGNAIDFLTTPTAQELIDLGEAGIDPTTITTGNATYNTIFHQGNYTDGPDSWWTSKFGSQIPLAYPGQAYVIFPGIALGESPSFPAFNCDYTWALNTDVSALGPDANPADWIQAFLTNQDWGVQGFPPSAIGDFTTAKNYWRATGLMISTSMTSPTAANSHLKSLMESLNADFRWSNGVLDIVPYGDVTTTANGYTYTPNTTPIYDLGVDDFLPNQGSLGSAMTSGEVTVAFSRTNVSDVFNKLQVEYLDRNNFYNPVTIYATDDASITQQGRLRLSDLKQNHWFCLAGAASMSCALQLHRLRTVVNTYQFTVGRQFVLLDVLDQVAITEPALGLVNQLVRITDIQENADSSLTMTAEEVPLTASAPLYVRQTSLGQGRNNSVAPGSVNAPLIFELPGQITHELQIQFAVSGQDPATWGGCTVWVSTDGTNYDVVGDIDGPARMGVLTAALPSVSTTPSGPTLDTTNTVSVNLTESAGSLNSGTSADLAALATLCLVDSELLAYQLAVLTSAYNYGLTELERGCYGTQASVVTHSIGAPFVRLDNAIFKWQYTNALIGLPLKFKFTSFNVYGTNEQSLGDATEYDYTPNGTPTPGYITISTATMAQIGLSETLAVTWVSDPLAASYEFEYSTDGGATYNAIQTNALSISVPGLGVNIVYVRVAGINSNTVAGPFAAPVEVIGPPLNITLTGIGISYDDLFSPAQQFWLDKIHDDDEEIIADAQSALAQAKAIAAAAEKANQNAASIIKVQKIINTATEASASAVTVISATLGNASAQLISFQQAQATVNEATTYNLLSLSASISTTNSNLAATTATLTSFQIAQATVNTATASNLLSLSATVSSNYATLTSQQTTTATALTALSSDVTTLSAQAIGVQSGGEMEFIAVAGPSGAYAAWELQVTASGEASSTATMTVSANSDGTSSVFFTADRFAIGDPATSTVPFQTLVGGGLLLNGIVNIGSTIQSTSLTGLGVPKLQIDFVNGIIDFSA